ncbi:hypothetical protein [Kribbella sp. NPDC049227]|uniref:hypothetical protein n=1 Tax=Kribbella sp. NPDC049227 TaxID=3364113 RepID=UPI0037233F72
MATTGGTTPPFDDLLAALRAIEQALKDPKSRALSTEVPIDVASSHLDYLAIRELMGRDRRPPDPENTFVFTASRSSRANSSKSVITIFDPPAVADKLAVFTSAVAAPEVVDIPGGVDRRSGRRGGSGGSGGGSGGNSVDVNLGQVTNDQPIVRLELRRDDGYPVRLGPRLAPI